MTSMRSSTGTSNSFIVAPYSNLGTDSEPVHKLLDADCCALAGIRQHHVSRNFHQLAIAAGHCVQVVLNHALAAFAEVFAKRFLDALEQIVIADSAFRCERGDAQKHAKKHDALHALLQV